MHSDVISCVIYISNKVEYLEKEESLEKLYQIVTLILSHLYNAINKTIMVVGAKRLALRKTPKRN